jgi:hypothetical protein
MLIVIVLLAIFLFFWCADIWTGFSLFLGGLSRLLFLSNLLWELQTVLLHFLLVEPTLLVALFDIRLLLLV